MSPARRNMKECSSLEGIEIARTLMMTCPFVEGRGRHLA
jgi:hypothetical protein